MMINNLALIPARGGSKGILRKNVRLLAGKPLIAHTIEAARASTYVSRVVVSTDDPEIAEVSTRYGAEIIWRPPELSTDGASSESALLHGLDYLREREGYMPDLLIFLQCTAPLTLPADIDGTVAALQESGAETAVAAAPFHYFLWDPAGNGINHEKNRRLLRQEREPQYIEAGAVYVMKATRFAEVKHRFFGQTAIYELPVERRLEIDDPVDFQIAEVLMRVRQQHQRQELLPCPVKAVIFDFDGVFTDNRVLTFQDAHEAVTSHRGDGYGIELLRRLGIPMLVISKEANPVVTARCLKLQLPVMQGIEEKHKPMLEWLASQNVDPAQAVYLGNDINDRDCLTAVGCGAVVADAHISVLPAAKLVLESRGGHGAVRELADLIVHKSQE
jgi:N-acylneuraminate cytidylyltransferase